MSDIRLRDAALQAEKLVRDEKLELPIDVLALAKRHDILVEPKPESAKGVSGMLLQVGNSFAIGYATHIQNNGFQRFSIAHELGHYFVPGHPEQVFRGGNLVHESRAGFGSGDQIELEADHFAASLLMPSHLFKAEAGRYSDGFAAIENAAQRCQTSLTASAIRYAQLTDAAVAIIVSTGQTLNYCFASHAMRNIKGFKHPTKGSLLPRDSLTRAFNQVESNILTARREDDSADLISWFRADDEFDASEEVIGLGDYGKSLTIICTDIAEEDEDIDDMTSRPPRFR